MKKILLPGLLAGIATLASGMALSFLFMKFPSIAADYANANLIRPWKDPLMSLFFLYPFVQGIILAWAWNKSKSLFQGTTVNRGLKFGLSIWLIASVPGMLISYSSFPLSLLTIVSWLTDGLVNGFIAGMIFAKMNK
ncbi:hypothetical protein HZA42_02985 [Candidatus Peregrinibacteria bacterium]|nr:hypothetical protein [Candidatus Peregrinibacteria bacterium]